MAPLMLVTIQRTHDGHYHSQSVLRGGYSYDQDSDFSFLRKPYVKCKYILNMKNIV